MNYQDKYIREYFLKNGKPFTIKDKFENQLKEQRSEISLFAIILKNNDLHAFKDFSERRSGIFLQLKNKKYINPKEGDIITSTGKVFESEQSFLKFYDKSDIKLEKFLKKKLEANTIKNNNNLLKKIKQKIK